MSAGNDHSLFTKVDGTLWAMGSNLNSQLGDGTNSHRSLPVLVATGVGSAAAGQAHSLFVKKDGSVWSMGSNGYGQLGDGTYLLRNQPVLIDNNATQVFAGGSHSHYLKADGSRWSMGANSLGQLGDGTTTDRNLPLSFSMPVAFAAAGPAHLLMIAPTTAEAGSFVHWITTFSLTGPDAAPGADPDADGLPNLMEYALGVAPDAATPLSKRPTVRVTVSEDLPQMIFQHRRLKEAAAHCAYLISSDLEEWTVLEVSATVDIADVDGDNLVELVSVSLPLDGANRRFIKLSVTE